MRTFKQGAQQFLVQLCAHASKTSPLNSLIARCTKCLSPPFMAECAESCEVMFDKLLTKMVSYKTISRTVADDAKGLSQIPKSC